MNVSPKVRVGGLVLAIGIAVFMLSRNLAQHRVSLAMESYACGDPSCGHVWLQELTTDPVCPECGAAGAKRAEYTCAKCNHTFTAWYTRRVEVGRYEVLLPGTTQWVSRRPSQLKCPQCGTVGALSGGAFSSRGYVSPNAKEGI